MPPHPDAVAAAEKTGHRRFLDLCDPDHPAYNPDYLAVVARIARGEDDPVPKPEPVRPRHEPLTRAWLARVDTCPYREPPACGCALPECRAGRGNAWGLVSALDCRACLRAADA